jgi:uncharacterized protein
MKIINILVLQILILGLSISCYSQSIKPQDPVGSLPYYTEDVVFENKMDGIQLAGTLSLPEKSKDYPVVILISGSGPQDRNSEILGHRPFLVLADHLTRQGIGVLRVDDRGVSPSQGEHNKSGLQEFTNDAIAAIEYLNIRNDTRDKKIGLVGHSLGGAVAPLAAIKRSEVDFLVLLAGPGINGDKLMLLQKEIIERKMGFGDSIVQISRNNIAGAYKIITESQQIDIELEKKLYDYFETTFGDAMPIQQIELMVTQFTIPWLYDLIKYKPEDVLKYISCPLLAINGSKDVQVPASENLAGIKNILNKQGNHQVEIMELEGLNHLFQECESGMPFEYSIIEQTFSPRALEIIANWINSLSKQKK